MRELVESLKQAGVLKTPRIISAFLANDRNKFVPAGFEADAYVDAPLPIGEGQTISQPYTVAFMMELLDPRLGQKILDIGLGSGWTAGILAHIVGEQGKVWGLEIIPELFEFGKSNLKKLGYKNIKLRNQSGWEGLPEAAPFDRIIAGAAARDLGVLLHDAGRGLHRSGERFRLLFAGWQGVQHASGRLHQLLQEDRPDHEAEE